jgi:Rieske Fe-S protein
MGEHGREMSRRVLLRGAAVTGVGVPLLAACGSDGDTTGGVPDGEATPSETGSPSENGAGATGAATVPTSDVPLGGGAILPDEKVVVTQPAKGDFKAFSAVCTHQGCTVTTVTDGTINCPCHGSKFAIADGSVVNGPATRPLEGLEATVEGDQVTVS